MSILHRLFKRKFVLPQPGDKVGFSNKVMSESNLSEDACYEVKTAHGDENFNIIYLHCSTVLKTGEWRILPKGTPIKC